MSQSQRSNFTSSIYDGDIDNLACLTPTDHLDTPEPSLSQRTFDLDSIDPEFFRPVIPLVPPESFIRVGPDRRKVFVRYDEMAHTEWVDWWLQTDFGRKSKICWDSNHQSGIWEKYDQVANSTDGAPKVMCKNCGQILEHPYTLHSRPTGNGKAQYHGTSSLSKHIKSVGCQRARRSGYKSEISKFLRKAVCFDFTVSLIKIA